jgi:hypothetical protein
MFHKAVGGGIYGQVRVVQIGFTTGGDMITRMIFGGLVAAVSTVVIAAPNALADNNVCVGVMNQSGCNPAPWNGQLMETWNTPGYYGGWTNGPVACDPFTRQCRGWAQP